MKDLLLFLSLSITIMSFGQICEVKQNAVTLRFIMKKDKILVTPYT